MSKVVAQINGVRDAGAASLSRAPTAPADVKAAAAQLLSKADALRKEIVATTEGGAITGEERLREHVDEIYGAINSVEDRPTAYQMAQDRRARPRAEGRRGAMGGVPVDRPCRRSTPSFGRRTCSR